MASTDDTTTLTVPNVPDDENEPPVTSQPYIAQEEQPSKEAGNDIDSSEEPTSPLMGGSNSISPSTPHSSIPIDLNNRETRLTLWSIAYFIFSMCEFTANSVVSDANANPKSAYQTWAASDFFLLIAASMLFIECNPRYILSEIKANENNLHKIFRYIIAGLFALGGVLRWFALGKHNNVNCNNSHCNSWHFAQDFMATYFSFVIAVDVLNLFEMINTNQRALRLCIYSSLMILCSIIVISWYDYVKGNYAIFFYNIEALRAWKTGWIFILMMLIIIVIISILICLQKYDGLLSDDKMRKYLHFSIAVIMNIGISLAYYSGALLFQTLLAVFVLLLITFDLMEFS
eukprot:355515_1